jgi:hypothetical protein
MDDVMCLVECFDTVSYSRRCENYYESTNDNPVSFTDEYEFMFVLTIVDLCCTLCC